MGGEFRGAGEEGGFAAPTAVEPVGRGVHIGAGPWRIRATLPENPVFRCGELLFPFFVGLQYTKFWCLHDFPSRVKGITRLP